MSTQNQMFCYQCQETAGCTGCTVSGVCGKKPDVAAMQDLLIYVTKGLSAITTELRAEGQPVSETVDRLVTVNLFTTITNANFDKEAIVARTEETLRVKEALRSRRLSIFRTQPLGTRRPISLKPKPPRKESASSPPRMKISEACANSSPTVSRGSRLTANMPTLCSKPTPKSMPLSRKHSPKRWMTA